LFQLDQSKEILKRLESKDEIYPHTVDFAGAVKGMMLLHVKRNFFFF
jgi:hypothetical protein